MHLTGPETLIRDTRLTGFAIHPLGHLPDRAIHFMPAGIGDYRSVEALPHGRWQIRVTAEHGRDHASYVEELSL